MVPSSLKGASSIASPKANKSAIFQNLASIVSVLSMEQMEGFIEQLGNALLHLSEQTIRPKESEYSFNAFNYLRKDAALFQQSFAAHLEELLAEEIQLAGQKRKAEQVASEMDLSLVTFEEMESKVLLGNIVQALELNVAEPLSALNLRVGWMLGRDEMPITENPFRPQIFVDAIYHAWQKIDSSADSSRVMLHLLGPNLFLPLEPIYRQLNEALVEHDILPNLSEAYRLRRVENKVGLPPPKVDKYDQSRYNKVRNWLLSAGKKEKTANIESSADLNLPDLFAPNEDGSGWGANTINGKVGPRIFSHLNELQSRIEQLEKSGVQDQVPRDAATLRQVKAAVPSGSLTAVDEKTIELLAGILDYVFQERAVQPEIKKLLGQLQITLLKAALLDKKFFVKEDHPARKLVDTLAKCSLLLNAKKGYDDPLYKMIEQIVNRVQKEFSQQMELFSEAVSGIETLLATEEKQQKNALAEPISKALRQERMNQAKEAAEKEVAARIETGEVATFVESFLETQWVRILTLAHSTQEQKPDVLDKALKAMDDLIWSIKPKNSPEQRKELISRLPSILSMLNAWLNAIKWHEPERVTFFSNLAERHAAIVRMQPEASPRHNVEMAVNIAEKASARRLRRHTEEAKKQVQRELQENIDGLVEGNWIELAHEDGNTVRLKLTWISPKRTRFIFTNRKEDQPSSLFTNEELAEALRDQKAKIIGDSSIVERALNAVLEPAHQ